MICSAINCHAYVEKKKNVYFSFGLNVFVHPFTKLFYEIKCTRLNNNIFATKGEDEIKIFGEKVKYKAMNASNISITLLLLNQLL